MNRHLEMLHHVPAHTRTPRASQHELSVYECANRQPAILDLFSLCTPSSCTCSPASGGTVEIIGADSVRAHPRAYARAAAGAADRGAGGVLASRARAGICLIWALHSSVQECKYTYSIYMYLIL